MVEVHVRYKGEVTYDDWIQVRVWVSEVKRAAIRFDYEILNESTGKVCTEGYSWHVFMGEARKAMSIPEDIKELLARNPEDFDVIG